MARTLVVGFDGATLDLVERFRDEGRMPTVSNLFADGSHGPLRSTFPYNSAVAWASLSTGVSPGRHGVFDFVLPREHEYRLRVATREDRRVPALWNHASQAGARVAVVNIPMTFPAEDVNGVMVSGMDAPGLDERAVHPGALLSEVQRMSPGYRIISKAAIEATWGDWEGAERELIDTLVDRSRFVTELARSRDFDLIMVNLEATDGAHHFFWQHFDPAHPRHDARLAGRFGDTIGRVYEVTDRELGRLIDAYRPDTVFVVSDHGGGPSNDWILFMNDWLADEGFLGTAASRGTSVTRRAYGFAMKHLSVPVKRRLRPLLGRAIERAKGSALYGDVDWTRTKAYAQMQPAVRLNLSGREPSGVVAGADRGAVLDEVAARARDPRLPDGSPVVAEAAEASKIYAGDAPGGPDLVMELTPGVEIKSRNTTRAAGHLLRLEDLGIYSPSGLHTPVGMVAAAGMGIEKLGLVAESDIHQVAASVLAVMGVAAPDLDGLPFDFVSARYRSTGGGLQTVEAAGADLTDAEEEEVLERLRGLGYVD